MVILRIPTEKSIERKVYAPRPAYGAPEYEAMREAIARCYFHFLKRRTLQKIGDHPSTIALLEAVSAAMLEKPSLDGWTLEQTVAATSLEPEKMLEFIRIRCEKIVGKYLR